MEDEFLINNRPQTESAAALRTALASGSYGLIQADGTKILRKFFQVLAVLFLSVSAQAGEALWTHQFAAESGFPVSLSQKAPPDGMTLVLFWASWCLPCKDELSELAKMRAQMPPNLRIVAVDTDDPSGLPLGQSFLASIRWPFEILRDNSGQFFYEHNRSGQLPFSVLVKNDGEELQTYPKLDHATIERIFAQLPPASLGPAPNETPQKVGQGWKTSYGFHTEAVDFSGDNDVHNRMATVTGYARLDSEHWSGQAEYDYMYEELNQPSTVERGDEIGYSYLEYRHELGSGRVQARLGDTHEAILSGELLSLQNIPNLLDPASLRGLSAQWDEGAWSVIGYGGEIHPALFATPINPTTDLALPVPGETVAGSSIYWHREGEGSKSEASLDFVNYHRDVNYDLGYGTAVTDQRLGAEVYHSWNKSGVQVRGGTFSANTGVTGIDADRPYIFDPYMWWTLPFSEHVIYSVHYLEYQSLPTRTLTPVLVENPSLPLQVAKVRSFRLSPKIFNEDETIWFEPVWIFEEAFDQAPYERQKTYGFNLSFPKQDIKVLAFYQDGLLSPESSYEEASLLTTAPIYGPLTTQVLLRHHIADPLGGDSDGVTLGLDLSRIWKMPMRGPLILSTQWTKQNGYYYGFSGIARSDLFSSHLEWSSGVNTVRLGIGAEPGGIVCTNGVCVQKPPLNGADLEVAFNF